MIKVDLDFDAVAIKSETVRRALRHSRSLSVIDSQLAMRRRQETKLTSPSESSAVNTS